MAYSLKVVINKQNKEKINYDKLTFFATEENFIVHLIVNFRSTMNINMLMRKYADMRCN